MNPSHIKAPAAACLLGVILLAGCPDREQKPAGEPGVAGSAAAPRKGTVRIESTPSGAGVYQDRHRRLGRTPLTLERPDGTFLQLTLIKEGHDNRAVSAVVEIVILRGHLLPFRVATAPVTARRKRRTDNRRSPQPLSPALESASACSTPRDSVPGLRVPKVLRCALDEATLPSVEMVNRISTTPTGSGVCFVARSWQALTWGPWCFTTILTFEC